MSRDEWVVDVGGGLIEELGESIRQGQIVEIREGKEPLRYLAEETVDAFKGLKVEIFAREHPPPHFRVKYQGSTANFRISDCVRLNGSGDVLRFENNIFVWWKDNKAKLIQMWDDRRPSDCPVGRYREPDLEA